eukprot:6970566-Prymnesium_polylepis.1
MIEHSSNPPATIAATHRMQASINCQQSATLPASRLDRRGDGRLAGRECHQGPARRLPRAPCSWSATNSVLSRPHAPAGLKSDPRGGGSAPLPTGRMETRAREPPMRRNTKSSITHHNRSQYVGPASSSSSLQPARKTGRLA